MKYIWVTHEAQLSGANQCMLEVVDELISQGNSIEIVLTREGEFAKILTDKKIKYFVILYYNRSGQFSFRMIKMMIRNVIAIFQLIKLFNQTKPDRVVSNTITVGVGAWAAFFSRKYHVWYIHEFGKEDHGIVFPLGEYLANKLIHFLSKKVIVVSKALKAKYSKYIAANKIEVLYNSPFVHDNMIKEEDSENRFKLIVVGQIAPGKRQEDAIKATAILKERSIPASLIILGKIVDENYHKYLLNLVIELGLQDEVNFKSFEPNPFQTIKNSDAVLICSKAEAFGRVTIEAMKLGVPVVGANVGATPELLGHGKYGNLYNYGDILGLADKLQYLYNNPIQKVELSKMALSYSMHYFSKEQLKKEIKEVF